MLRGFKLSSGGPFRWSPDGARLAVLETRGALKAWRVEDGEELFAVQAHDQAVVATELAWSPDGDRLATGAYDGLIKVWDTREWMLLLTLAGESDVGIGFGSREGFPIDDLEFSPDGKRIAVGDTSVRIWAGNNSADANRLLDRLEHLRRLDVPESLFHDVPAHRITRLRRQGERYFADGLRELPDSRRLAILAVCAVEWELFLADAVVETHDRIVGRTYREAARTCDGQLGDETAAVREALRAFAELGTALIGARDTGETLDAVIADRPGWEGLGDLVARADALANTVASDPLNHVLGGYSRFRRYTPRMLRTLDIEASPVAKPLQEAVDVLRSDATARPTGFLRPNSKWSRLLRSQSDHRLWETAVLFHLRDAFRAGDVWLARSRRYGDIRKALLSAPAVADADRSLPVPASPHDWLAERRFALDEGLRRLAAAARARVIAGGSIEDSMLRVERTEGAVPDGAADLVADLYRRMPDARITDILLEVDDATRFTEAFTHLRTGSPCRDRIGLLNVLLAEGINLGLRKMAEATTTHGFWELMRIARWHVEGEAYDRALSTVVEAQAALPMAAFWGTGRTASSDGQFFPAGGRGELLNLVNARYGTEPGVKAYSHVSDRFSPVRHADHPGDRPRSPLHPRRAPDERDREARPRTVRRHGRLHRPCLRRVLDPRLRVRAAHPRPAFKTPLRVRTGGRPEAPAPAGRRQGERGADQQELGGHPARGGHHGRRDHAPEPDPAQARRVSAPERDGGGPAGSRAHRTLPVHDRLGHGPRHAPAHPGRLEQGRGAPCPQSAPSTSTNAENCETEPGRDSTTGSPASRFRPNSWPTSRRSDGSTST